MAWSSSSSRIVSASIENELQPGPGVETIFERTSPPAHGTRSLVPARGAPIGSSFAALSRFPPKRRDRGTGAGIVQRPPTRKTHFHASLLFLLWAPLGCLPDAQDPEVFASAIGPLQERWADQCAEVCASSNPPAPCGDIVGVAKGCGLFDPAKAEECYFGYEIAVVSHLCDPNDRAVVSITEACPKVYLECEEDTDTDTDTGAETSTETGAAPFDDELEVAP